MTNSKVSIKHVLDVSVRLFRGSALTELIQGRQLCIMKRPNLHDHNDTRLVLYVLIGK